MDNNLITSTPKYMDYEKKYNEALEIARQIHNGNPSSGTAIVVCEQIFPELRESEDEKTRTLLVALVQWAKTFSQSGLLPNVTNKMLAYLERQKDQKPNYCHHEVDETGWTEEYRKAYYDGWNNCNMQHEQLKAGHKPVEWSEEDERVYDILLNEFKQLYDGRSTSLTRKETIDIYNFVKSLRPQSHWKPSEEQMDCLCAAVDAAIRKHNESVSGYKPARVLKSLYEQLQKLM